MQIIQFLIILTPCHYEATLSDVKMLIVTKNIISTAKTETKITVISLEVSSIKDDILSSPIGSTIAAPIL